jgi:tripartite-type tricarboxylate transporter receptor subunit TctC
MEAARKGKFSYSSAGAGTTPHLSAEYLFKVLGKLDVTHVPFGGAGPATTAVLSSQVELGSVALPAAVEFVKAGGIKAYAVTSTKRVPSLPDVPTVAECGFPDFSDVTWVALLAPSKTPAAIAERLNREIAAVQKQPAFQAKMAAQGFDLMGGSLPELKVFLHNDLQKWAKVVKDVGAITD